MPCNFKVLWCYLFGFHVCFHCNHYWENMFTFPFQNSFVFVFHDLPLKTHCVVLCFLSFDFDLRHLCIWCFLLLVVCFCYCCCFCSFYFVIVVGFVVILLVTLFFLMLLLFNMFFMLLFLVFCSSSSSYGCCFLVVAVFIFIVCYLVVFH